MEREVRKRFEELESRFEELRHSVADAIPSYCRRAMIDDKFDEPLPPFKFEVGQMVYYINTGIAIGLPGKIEARELRSCPVYRVNGYWFSEDVIEVVPPSRFKVGDWVRTSNDHVGRALGVDKLLFSNHYDVLLPDGRTISLHEELLEPWHPRDGEWVVSVNRDAMHKPFSMPWQYDKRVTDEVVIPAPLGSHAADWFK